MGNSWQIKQHVCSIDVIAVIHLSIQEQVFFCSYLLMCNIIEQADGSVVFYSRDSYQQDQGTDGQSTSAVFISRR